MKNRTVNDYRTRLDYLFAHVPTEENLELRAHWARYLCVLVSGLLEVGFAALCADHAKRTASPRVSNFAEWHLERFQNPKMELVLTVFGRFDREWERQLRTATEGRIKDAVDSIVDVRHKIAHGENVGITYIAIKNYYVAAVECLELIEALTDP
jgi:hypothetical protein